MGTFDGLDGRLAVYREKDAVTVFFRGTVRVVGDKLSLDNAERYNGGDYHGKLCSKPTFDPSERKFEFNLSELKDLKDPEVLKNTKLRPFAQDAVVSYTVADCAVLDVL